MTEEAKKTRSKMTTANESDKQQDRYETRRIAEISEIVTRRQINIAVGRILSLASLFLLIDWNPLLGALIYLGIFFIVTYLELWPEDQPSPIVSFDVEEDSLQYVRLLYIKDSYEKGALSWKVIDDELRVASEFANDAFWNDYEDAIKVFKKLKKRTRLKRIRILRNSLNEAIEDMKKFAKKNGVKEIWWLR